MNLEGFSNFYDYLLISMIITAVIVFISLFFITAGYGQFSSKKWGPLINNKIAWVLMELPVFLLMGLLWWHSDRKFDLVPLIIFIIFQTHYFHRTFIFPLLIKGKNKTPLSIILFSWIFNSINAIMQGGWLFYLAPENLYQIQWLSSPQFIIGTIIFCIGLFVNIQSDGIIRNLRKGGDNNHHIPQGGMFKYVSSANYFGELLEWIGFAILTWSLPGLVFAIWTFANLGPRAHKIRNWYTDEFGEEFTSKGLKRIIPKIF